MTKAAGAAEPVAPAALEPPAAAATPPVAPAPPAAPARPPPKQTAPLRKPAFAPRVNRQVEAPVAPSSPLRPSPPADAAAGTGPARPGATPAAPGVSPAAPGASPAAPGVSPAAPGANPPPQSPPAKVGAVRSGKATLQGGTSAASLGAGKAGSGAAGIALGRQSSAFGGASVSTAQSPAGRKPDPAPVAEPEPPSAGVKDEYAEEEQTRIADVTSLAGAFSAAVSGPQGHSPIADPSSMPGDEWFVGINGVPVGPIRLSELRSKAGSGSITKESLVWRDGFEEWRPLKSFPELVAIVEESLSSVRTSLTPFMPETALPSAAATSSVTALSDPFAQDPARASAASLSGAVAGGALISDDLEAAGLRRKRTSPTATWIAMVVAVLFGLTLGFVFFSKQQQPAEIIKYVEVPAKEQPAPVGALPSPSGDTPIDDPKSIGKSSGVPKPTAKVEPENSKLTGGLKGLGLSGLSAGPKAPAGGNVPASTGGQLDQAQLQPVVARYTSSVKRSCWQPALDTRDKDAPTSARVNVTIAISGSGTVQNVTHNGDPRGYRGLANCIAGRVRGWQFPAAGGSTTVNVPFVFVAQ